MSKTKLIHDISKIIKQSLDESYGTLQYETEKNKGFIRLLNTIVSDIKKSDNTKSYILSYNNIISNYGVKWLNGLDLEIKNNVFSNVSEAYALIEVEDKTIFNKQYIELATILVNNPLDNKLLKSSIAHELNHYVKYFNTNASIHMPNDTDLLISNNSKTMQLKYDEYYDIFKQINTFTINDFSLYGKLKTVYLDILYYCNKSEINAHMENVYGEFMLNDTTSEIKSITEVSQTCALYDILRNYLNTLLMTDNNDFKQFANKYIKKEYIKTGNISFEKIVKRYIQRINVFLEKASKLYLQLK